jgi:hypothetical protein
VKLELRQHAADVENMLIDSVDGRVELSDNTVSYSKFVVCSALSQRGLAQVHNRSGNQFTHQCSAGCAGVRTVLAAASRPLSVELRTCGGPLTWCGGHSARVSLRCDGHLVSLNDPSQSSITLAPPYLCPPSITHTYILLSEIATLTGFLV